MEILYTSSEIHAKIKSLFLNPRPKDKRIVIAAYIGRDVKAFLPSPRGITVICNPDPVSTSIEAVTYLKQKGAKVFFSNSLHMKVYYSKQRGCIITSANLSNNALGSGNLKEIGVFLPSESVDIDRIVKSVKPYKISNSKLIKMDSAAKKIQTALKGIKPELAKDKGVEFSEWYHSRKYILWKMSSYQDDDVPFAKQALEITNTNYNKKEPHSIMSLSKNMLKPADWLLCYKTNKNNRITGFEWMYIDFCVPVGKT